MAIVYVKFTIGSVFGLSLSPFKDSLYRNSFFGVLEESLPKNLTKYHRLSVFEKQTGTRMCLAEFSKTE